MSTLNGKAINETFDGLLKTSDENALPATGRVRIQDGLGNDTALSIGRAGEGIAIDGPIEGITGGGTVSDKTFSVSSLSNFISNDLPFYVSFLIDGETCESIYVKFFKGQKSLPVYTTTIANPTNNTVYSIGQSFPFTDGNYTILFEAKFADNTVMYDIAKTYVVFPFSETLDIISHNATFHQDATTSAYAQEYDSRHLAADEDGKFVPKFFLENFIEIETVIGFPTESTYIRSNDGSEGSSNVTVFFSLNNGTSSVVYQENVSYFILNTDNTYISNSFQEILIADAVNETITILRAISVSSYSSSLFTNQLSSLFYFYNVPNIQYNEYINEVAYSGDTLYLNSEETLYPAINTYISRPANYISIKKVDLIEKENRVVGNPDQIAFKATLLDFNIDPLGDYTLELFDTVTQSVVESKTFLSTDLTSSVNLYISDPNYRVVVGRTYEFRVTGQFDDGTTGTATKQFTLDTPTVLITNVNYSFDYLNNRTRISVYYDYANAKGNSDYYSNFFEAIHQGTALLDAGFYSQVDYSQDSYRLTDSSHDWWKIRDGSNNNYKYQDDISSGSINTVFYANSVLSPGDYTACLLGNWNVDVAAASDYLTSNDNTYDPKNVIAQYTFTIS